MKTADLGVLSNQAAMTNKSDINSARETNTGAIPSSRAFQPSATVELPENRFGGSSNKAPEPDNSSLKHMHSS